MCLAISVVATAEARLYGVAAPIQIVRQGFFRRARHPKNNRLNPALHERLSCAGAHASTQDDAAIAQQLDYAHVVMGAMLVAAVFMMCTQALGMRGAVVGSYFAVFNDVLFQFKDNETGASAKML
jgi:hypothetical protein